MSLARWKDLCLDASGAGVVAEFWSSVLNLEIERQEGGDAVLRGASSGQTIWIDQVPEPKTAKNRVHLDLVRPDVQPLLQLGARVVQQVDYPGHSWKVLTDPEGNEFCVFDADPQAPTALVVDSTDPGPAARWWSDVLGAELKVAPGGDLRWLGNVAELPFDLIKFVGVEDVKVVKNRMHWDVLSNDVSALVAKGARVLRKPDNEVYWHVLADPEGNEFCVDSY